MEWTDQHGNVDDIDYNYSKIAACALAEAIENWLENGAGEILFYRRQRERIKAQTNCNHDVVLSHQQRDGRIVGACSKCAKVFWQ